MPMLPKKHKPFTGKAHGEDLGKKRSREVTRKRYVDGESNPYKTAKWKRLRREILSQQPICIVHKCGQLATDVDHIQPHRGDMSVFYDSENLQAMCRSCHARKTATSDGGFGNKTKDAH